MIPIPLSVPCGEMSETMQQALERAEDERDRLYQHAVADFPHELHAQEAAAWLRERASMLPSERAELRASRDGAAQEGETIESLRHTRDLWFNEASRLRKQLDAVRAALASSTPSEIGWRQRQGGSE